MPLLKDLPANVSVFIDANIFLEHFLRGQPTCGIFLERVWRKEILGVTSVGVIAEVRHGLLRAEASAHFHLPARKTLAYLREHPQMIAHLIRTREALVELSRWPLRIVQLTRGQFWRACRISERYGLLTNDALHLATMRAHHLRHLVSSDRDFRHVPRLTVWHP